MREEELLAQFQSPSSKYRSLLFWAWNAKLEEGELTRQIGEMHKAGSGGFFIHSRDGLETVYMGDEWKRLVRASVLAARELGLEAWLYDEDRWPSGTAGGTVPARWGDESRCKGLTLEVCKYDAEFNRDEAIALYAAKADGMNIDYARRLKEGEKPDAHELLLITRLEVSEKSEWFNNEAPPDNLNPVSVRHFIEATHEEYKKTCGDFFGTVVPGIFTDEPSLNDRHAKFPGNRGWIPWTMGFEENFKKRRDYDVLDILPFLYFNGKKSAKIRHDYWRTITEVYAEAYSGEIAKWCKSNNIAYTGHFLQEDKLGLSTRVNGGIMLHYRYQDIPGIDILCERTDEYLTVKQCSSVAHQYGKQVVLSEAFGCTGWDFNFEAQKWVGDWQYALGVNRLVKHMALYTLKGCAKRDYPPSFNYNHSSWNYARTMEDYHARLSAVLTEGAPVRDVLVLHPSSSAWSRLGCNPYGNPRRNTERDVPAINEYGNNDSKFLAFLSGIHYDYDLGDELLLAEDGAVEGNLLKLAEAKYALVILPPIDTMLQSTLDLLERFLSAGGTLIAVQPLPGMIEGEKNNKLSAFFKHTNISITDNFLDVEKILESKLKRKISITNPEGIEDNSILYLLKNTDNFYSLFIANNDRKNSHKITIQLPNEKTIPVRRLDPLTGDNYSEIAIDGSINEKLGPADSRIYLFEKDAPEFQGITPSPSSLDGNSRETFYASLPPECKVERNMPNALTIDRCSWRFKNGPVSEEMEVWQAQAQIRSALGMRDISHNGILQRYKWIEEPHPMDGKETALVFKFTAEAPLEGIKLVVEESGSFIVSLNGVTVPNQSSGWFLDRDFHTVPLPRLAEGENTLELVTGYKNSTQLEDIYLIGDFSVNSRRYLIVENPYIRTGDWTLQGYPHYAGSLIYAWNFFHAYEGDARVILKLEDYSAFTLRLRVNDYLHEIPWKAAARVDITDALSRNANNRISVEAAGSPRNLLGPFHVVEQKPAPINDGSFHPRESEHVEGYFLRPSGLFAPPKLFLSET